MAVGVTTGLAVSAFNLAESHGHASVFDFTFQTFLVAPSETDVDVLTTETTNEMLLNKFQTLSQNSGNASFVSHSLQVIVPTLGGCVVSALRDVAGGSFLGEEAVGTFATSRAAAVAAVSREEENKNAMKTSSVVLEDVKKTVLKTVAAVVTLGTGASLGPE